MCSSFFAINLCCLICFLQPQHFEDMPFLTFYRIPRSGVYTKYLFFLSEFSKPKMALELTNKSRWFKCSMHGGTGKHQTLEIRWWASTSLCSYHRSLPLFHPLFSLPLNPHFFSLSFYIQFCFLRHHLLGPSHLTEWLWHHGKSCQTLCETKDTQLLCLQCCSCNTTKNYTRINEKKGKRKGWFWCRVTK